MTETPSPNNPNPSPDTPEMAEELLVSLRQKQGTWVDWGRWCAALQKMGHSSQAIFEATGFEPIQQNQVIVGAQVYGSLEAGNASPEVRSHFATKGSDSLYELRILSQAERVAAAEYLVARNLDSEGAKEVAKELKEFSRLRVLPEGFTDHPGDAVAYQYWRRAKQNADLQERSRLIARGLMFAHSQTARQQIEKLLLELSGGSQRPAPTLPLYRLEAEEELPRMVPLAGALPLTAEEIHRVYPVTATGKFQVVKPEWKGDWVALPGWQILRNAEDPVAILANSQQLNSKLLQQPEELLLVCDRDSTAWEANAYFLVEQDGQIQVQWFASEPTQPLLARLLLILRAKRIFDEESTKDVWQIEE